MTDETDDVQTGVLGTWHLLSVEHTTAAGEVGHPWGERPIGHMIFTPDGYMSVILLREGRRAFADGDVLSATAEERAEAFMSGSAFVGRYHLEGGKVRFDLEACTFPNWVGTSQLRDVEIDGDGHLVLTTPMMLMEGEQRSARVVLERR